MEKKIASFAQKEKLNQMRMMLDANGVLRPHIVWLQGDALQKLMESIGKEPFFKDGRIFHHQFYRFNLCTGRYKQVDPRQ